MGLHARIWFTAAQKAELWERWKNGQSAAAISRALERRNKTGVERIVVLHGGIAPAPRRRALAALPPSFTREFFTLGQQHQPPALLLNATLSVGRSRSPQRALFAHESIGTGCLSAGYSPGFTSRFFARLQNRLSA